MGRCPAWRRRSRCRSDELAEEVAQSVFATVASKLGSGQYAERGKFEAWLFRVAMNRLRDEMRRRKRQAAPADPGTLQDVQVAPDQRETDTDGIAQLRDAMTELADADREVVELRHHAQMSFKQIAELLDQPLGTVLARHHRALRKLKSLIEEASSKAGELT
ncbi:MAG: sigma-70 family RNA polymerase sigma factor [Planctomycetota bacterium]